MGASLKTGLAALEKIGPALHSVLVMLCDQPFVTSVLLQQLLIAHNTTDQPIVAAQYGEVRGVPVLFGAEALPLLHQLPDAAGANQLLKQHSELVTTVPFPEGAIDIDTPEQYTALLAR
jgi:molybdenum cofactor cytidylyltransferase